MAWTKITRRQYARQTARYASDMTDREWGNRFEGPTVNLC